LAEVDAGKLIELLAERLNPTLPPGTRLDAAQDDIAHATRGTAWPGDGRSLPTPWARVERGVLLCGYGDGVLTLEPMRAPHLHDEQRGTHPVVSDRRHGR
jgi:hypothetical protein